MARQHIVTCQRCGRQFDANRGGYYNRQTRRYTCKSCGKNAEANRREATTGMRQSIPAMIAKIFFGVVFIFAGFSPTEGQSPVVFFLTAFAIGAALIAWGIVPYIKAKKQRKQDEMLYRQAQQILADEQKTCPSCGAVGKGKFCEYCGTQLK